MRLPRAPQLGEITVEEVEGGGAHITSRLDNPELRTLVQSTFGDPTACFDMYGACVYVSSLPQLSQQATVVPGGMSFPAGDIELYTHGTTTVDALGLPVREQGGSVTTSLMAWAEADLIRDRSQPIELYSRGLRLGYTPMAIEVHSADSRGKLGPTLASLTVALDPFVQLVPVQVFVLHAGNHEQYAGLGSLEGNLEVWDQVPAFQRTNFVDDGAGIAASEYTFSSWFGTTDWKPISVTPTWEMGGFQGYQPLGTLIPCTALGCHDVPDNSAFYTPDSIWRDCGVQFRLVRFARVDFTDDDCFGTKAGVYSGCSGNLTDGFNGESIENLCDVFETAVKAKALGGKAPTLPTVIVDYKMAAPIDASPAAVVRFPGGINAPVTCIGQGAAGPNQWMNLAHEVAHWRGTVDECDYANGSCQMDAKYNATAPPSSSECVNSDPSLLGMRDWAISNWSNFWDRPCAGRFCPPPPAPRRFP